MMNPKVDFFFNQATKWQKEYKALRALVLDCGLTEELKWGEPCYTFQKNNVVLIHGFKEYCALLFFKGALLDDPDKILIKQSENVQAGRQVRFTAIGQIQHQRATLKAYLFEAIEIERAGLKVIFKTTDDFAVPEEFQKKLDELPALKSAFATLTPGRQRAYLFYFSEAKQTKTRQTRVEKNISRILAGKGMND